MINKIRLSERDKADLRLAREEMLALQIEITRAERAGLDPSDQKKELENAIKLVEGLLREYAD